MSIQLISISHKTAPMNVREKFAFSPRQRESILEELYSWVFISECVIISTCNRTEVYLWSENGEKEREIFEYAKGVLIRGARLENMADIGHIFRFYSGDKAIHHLFLVACGLDSMVIGEDQILGQVKDAHQFAVKLKTCAAYLNTLFRYSVTAAKKVKTDTALSKIPVSTAIICIRAAQSYLGTLDGKNIMIIGASGQIGSIVKKNLLSDYKARLFVTTRDENLENSRGVFSHGKETAYYTYIPYKKRYEYLADMDVVISATSSPHYTLTYDSVEKCLVFGKDEEHIKPRAFMDLAVPMDIESRISSLPGVMYSNIDDCRKIAQSNNAVRRKEADSAFPILEAYETDFKKWMIFQQSLKIIEDTRREILREGEQKGMERALSHFFYRVRESVLPQQLEIFMECLKAQHKSED